MNSKRSFQKTSNRLGAALPGQAWPGREPEHRLKCPLTRLTFDKPREGQNENAKEWSD